MTAEKWTHLDDAMVESSKYTIKELFAAAYDTLFPKSES